MKIKLFGKEIPIVAVAVPGLVLIILLIVIISVNSSKSSKVSYKHPIELEPYIDIHVDGYNGYASASISIDWKEFDEDNENKYKVTKAGKARYGSYWKEMSFSDFISDYVVISLDKVSLISNGDRLHYSWHISDKLYEYVECYLEYDNNVYNVDGLSEAPTKDFFEGVELSYSGISPRGNAQIQYVGEYLCAEDFSISESENIKNGDILTVKLELKDEWYYLSNFGAIPAEYTKQFVVSGMDEYICSVDSVPEESLTYMKGEASDNILSYIARNYSVGVSVGDFEYMGYVINCKTYLPWSGSQNDMYIIYRAPVSITTGKFRETYVYYPVRFTDLMIYMKLKGF